MTERKFDSPESLGKPTLPQHWQRVTIIGLGLLGGSLAAALRRKYPALQLVGVDRPEVLQSQTARQLVHRGISLSDTAEVQSSCANSDLVFLAATIGGIESWLPAVLRVAPLVTDCGSTKRRLVRAARLCPGSDRFVPGHPMAGALGGLSGAHADLFVDQPWVLCGEAVQPAALQAVQAMVQAVGGRVTLMTPEEHDRVVATTSHVPRLMASSLTGIALESMAFGAAGPAFERLLRGAGGSTAMWADILQSNRDEVASTLKLLIADLQLCARELSSSGGLPAVLSLLETAERARLEFYKGRKSEN